jgi:lysophospholipid acyltransferase (LPLAT)-like uncharacterized protein
VIKKIAPYLLFFVYKVIQLTWRIRIDEGDVVGRLVKDKKSFIIAHWHGDELGILHLLKKYHVACIISTSKDGDLMNRAVQLLGAETVRGSSTRGGTQALKGIIRLKKKGRRPSVAVDGPKGPIFQVKSGVFQISKLTQLPIAPISFYASSTFVFKKSWNKSQLPLPFAKVTICFGETLNALTKNDDPRDKIWAESLKGLIHATQLKAEQIAKESRAF